MKYKKKTFTMLELIVSMSVLLVMMTIMMQFFSSAQKAWVASSEQADVYDNARIAMDLITSDLNSIFYKPSCEINFYHPGVKDDKLGFFTYSNGGVKKIIYKLNTASNSNRVGFLVRYADGDKDYTTKKISELENVFNMPDKDFSRIIPNVCEISFKCFDNKLKEINSKGQFPWYVQVELVLMGSRSYAKWKAFGNTSKADEIKDAYGVKINKLVYLVNRGQPLTP